MNWVEYEDETLAEHLENMMEKQEVDKVEKYEEEMRTQGKGDAMQYPYLCEYCNRNETHGTNRFCDNCKGAEVHHEEHYYPDSNLCGYCGGRVYESELGYFCANCQEPEYNEDENEWEYDAYKQEEQMALECVRKIQDAGSAVNIARAEVELAQARLKKAEAFHYISKAEYNLYYFDRIKGESEIVSARAKLAEAEVEIENAEATLRAAQDAWVWR